MDDPAAAAAGAAGVDDVELAVVLVLALSEVDELELLDPPELESGFRLSVRYQPDPLKIMGTGTKRRRDSLLHLGQSAMHSSLKLCLSSKLVLHFEQTY